MKEQLELLGLRERRQMSILHFCKWGQVQSCKKSKVFIRSSRIAGDGPFFIKKNMYLERFNKARQAITEANSVDELALIADHRQNNNFPF